MADFFGEWAEQHGRVFGFTDAELMTVLSWRSLFLAADYTGTELRAATAYLASHVSEIQPFLGKTTGHLEAIQRVIRDLRTVTARKSAESRDYGECTICGNTGFAIVPRLEAIHENQWRPLNAGTGHGVRYTMAVLCSCSRGRFKQLGNVERNRTTTPREMMTLERYEQMNPYWKAQTEQRALEEREAVKLQPPSLFSGVVAKIMERARKAKT